MSQKPRHVCATGDKLKTTIGRRHDPEKQETFVPDRNCIYRIDHSILIFTHDHFSAMIKRVVVPAPGGEASERATACMPLIVKTAWNVFHKQNKI